jgi:excisionase family DNA binding protein
MNTNIKYLNRKQLADILNCSPGTIYRLTVNGAIPYIKIGSDLRYSLDSVLHVLEANAKTEKQKP